MPKYASCWDELGAIDVAFCVSWRYMIPPHIYNRPSRGTFVFHDSLLPKYRGFAPTVWSIVNGESSTGVTLMEIAEEVDAGDVVDQLKVPIGETDTIADVLENVTSAYLVTLERNIFGILDGSYNPVSQDHSLATYTVKRTEVDYRINWTKPARVIYDLIRGCTVPYPGAFTTVEGVKYRLWEANLYDTRTFETHSPGRFVGDSVLQGKRGISILCGDLKPIHVTKITRAEAAEGSQEVSLSMFKFSTTFV